MNETPLEWLAQLPALLAAARTGSATAAARKLELSTATVLRHLASLEKQLDVRLFDRTPTGLLPTAALEQVLPWAERVEAAALGLEREVRGVESAPEGVVRIALLPALASRIVVPALPRLLARYPRLKIELLPGSAVVDLVRREADIALRTVRPERGDLIARRLIDVDLVVAAAPSLLKATAPASLSDLPWLAWSAETREQRELRWMEEHVPNARIALRSSDLETLLRAAQMGLGAIVIAEPIAAASGGLVRVPVETPPLPRDDLWLVGHRALRHVPRFAVVWEWIVEHVAGVADGATTVPRLTGTFRGRPLG